MTEMKKAGKVRQFFDNLRNTNKQEHAASADNNARLGYVKGNIDQNKLKNTRVWDTCPVLDEQGKPLQDQ